MKNILQQQFGFVDRESACLWIIYHYYNKGLDPGFFKRKMDFAVSSVSLYSLGRKAEDIGFRAKCVELGYSDLLYTGAVSCILQWDADQVVVLLPCAGRKRRGRFKVIDPSGKVTAYGKEELMRHWTGLQVPGTGATGKILLLEPSAEMWSGDRKNKGKLSWRTILRLFHGSRRLLLQIVFALLIASFVQLIFPFIMQAIVDIGINGRDLHYISVLLIAQFVLIFSRVTADLMRGRLLLHISTRINLAILSDFWIKLMHLPLDYFENRHTGELFQRITDNKQIQTFVTGPALNTFFSMLNFIVFSIVLMMYKADLFLAFISGITLYFLWMWFFLKFRRRINNQVFQASARENNITLQLVQGMSEIRLQNIEQSKRWEWEKMQVRIFRLNFKSLTYVQLQQAGAIFINQGKDMILTFMVARYLIGDQLTFGALLAVQYIIGQLSGPVEQFIGFVQTAQDAKISMERLNEVHSLENEEKNEKEYIRQMPPYRTLFLNHVSFSYPGENPRPALHDIQLEIPQGKITALVGESGCGKTTLLKLLLKFYNGYEGSIRVGNLDFRDLSPSYWRSKCGAVLQDSYIFQDTIRKNIATGDEPAEEDKILDACRIANILPFIESLPDGLDTELDLNGSGISQGQKQRLLIARAIYKDPDYVLFDESTNSLDEINEKIIVKNLGEFFKNRTVVLVAHRMSTVVDAHNIVVLHQGRVIEQGTHEELTRKKGRYFKLVRTQLEMGVE